MKNLFFLVLCLLIWPILAWGAGLVDINEASLEQLDTLIGIGPKLGQKIIDNRPYASIDDLLKVSGIGPKNLEKIKQQGLACINCQEPTTDTINTPKQITNNEASTTPEKENAPIRADRPTLTQNNIGQKNAVAPNNISLSEVLPSPEGADTENEFIEIFNANNFLVDLSSWKIKDKLGAVKTYTLPENTKIQPNGFLVLKSSQTKISLNNSGDGVELLNPNSEIVDSTEFEKSSQGQSWSKSDLGWAWTAKPTPGQANIIVAIQQANASTSPIQASSSAFVANINSYPPQRKNCIAVAIATTIALSSALIAWRIKKRSHEI